MSDFISRVSDYLEQVEAEFCKYYCKYCYDCADWVNDVPGSVHRPEFDECPFFRDREKV